MSDDDLDTLDVAGAADFLKMSKDAVMRKARNGAIPGAKMGKHWVFVKADLIETIRRGYLPQYTNRKKQEFTLFDSRLEEEKLESRLGLPTRPKQDNTSKR